MAADDAEGQFWSQQDGATLHTARETTDCLTTVSPGRNILRFGDSAWPARFPDFTALGYVSSGIFKAKAYANKPGTFGKPKEHIRDEIRVTGAWTSLSAVSVVLCCVVCVVR